MNKISSEKIKRFCEVFSSWRTSSFYPVMMGQPVFSEQDSFDFWGSIEIIDRNYDSSKLTFYFGSIKEIVEDSFLLKVSQALLEKYGV